MSLSSNSSGAGSRAGSPEDENGKPKSHVPPATPASLKQERFADLKRRSAYAFSMFANEEREKLLSTHPDLPMGVVTRMMVEKWKSLDAESKMPYFEAARSPMLKAKKPANNVISETTPPKKLRPIIAYTPTAISMSEQVAKVNANACVDQQQSKVIILQGRLANQVNEASKPQKASIISASIAQALGVTITPHKTVSAPMTIPNVNPPPLRTVSIRPRPSTSVVVSAQQITAAPMTVTAPTNETQVPRRREEGPYGFATSQQALDMFYLALCEPAFPHPDEPPLTPYPASYCYEAYLKMTSSPNGSVM